MVRIVLSEEQLTVLVQSQASGDEVEFVDGTGRRILATRLTRNPDQSALIDLAIARCPDSPETLTATAADVNGVTLNDAWGRIVDSSETDRSL